MNLHLICGTEAPTSGIPEVGAEVPWAKDGLKIEEKSTHGEEFSM